MTPDTLRLYAAKICSKFKPYKMFGGAETVDCGQVNLLRNYICLLCKVKNRLRVNKECDLRARADKDSEGSQSVRVSTTREGMKTNYLRHITNF
jgi:hypothetical protein